MTRRQNVERWAGRSAIVTGAASGIGRAIAARLVAQGAWVTLADRDADGVRAAADELAWRGPGRAHPVTLDVADGAAVERACQRVASEHGRLDLMVNNAGVAVAGPVERLDLAHWDTAIDVNLRGVAHGVHAAYPIMARQRHGQILNTASLAGLAVPPLMAPYVATKWAVVGLSLSLRAEAARHGVRVSVLCPGFTDTPMLGNVNPGLPSVGAAERGRVFAARRAGSRSRLGRLHDPDRLADQALRGLARDQPLIVVPASARLVWRIGRLAPARLTLALTRAAARDALRAADELPADQPTTDEPTAEQPAEQPARG